MSKSMLKSLLQQKPKTAPLIPKHLTFLLRDTNRKFSNV